MNILILGGGGREHALAWRIGQSPHCGRLYCAPGNAGIATVADCVAVSLKPPFGELIAFCRERKIGFVVVGPEEPLALGVVDALADAGIEAFGPRAAGAQIEASKKFAKEIMKAAGIPTGAARDFTDSPAAIRYLDELAPPYVIKADGLAAGKGVTIARTREEAEEAIRAALDLGQFDAAGRTVLIEEYLEGVEASLLAFTDGATVRAMDSAQDYKQVFDGDLGPNTGGMGSLSPAPVLTPELKARAVREILEPAVAELRARGISYQGVLYAGLMITPGGPKVIEFNCRFGDPETQALVPRLETDLVEVMLGCARGTLDQIDFRWRDEVCVCVVAASGGYPGPYAKGKVIEGLLSMPGESSTDVVVFHAGTGLDADGRIVTSGGRVLGVTALGPNLDAAREKAYGRLRRISFEGMQFRKDIGFRSV